ncbi:restriction endonuclease subunit S [uncultured Selenomonas sp.]|uniref:restriction endonuclease subunit S n=1 Tax=uncultured Selenomonas sp. TaxID=159275 RepID=UPI0025F04BC9|nr:restriction endonuclease subunit S [uncultured Selenomonas sp.]
MKRYPAYQKTELPWLKEVPVTWQLIRNKQFLTERKEFVGKDASKYPLLSLTKQGVILRDVSSGKGKFPKEFDSYKVVEPSNAIFCLFDMDETPRTIGISKYRGMITGAYDVFELSNINSRFFYYYYASLDDKKDLKPLYTGLRKTIGVETFLHAKMPVPSKEEQQQIVLYLDTKTAQIDCAIRGYERLVALLEERKTAVINEAVTKGVRRGIVTKESGVNWLDKIPQHWEMRYAKQLFALRRDKAREDDEQLTSSQKYGIISQQEFMEREGRRVTVVLKGEDILKHVEAGDFVISMRSFQGGLEYSHVSGKISSAYVMLIPNHDLVYDRYFRWLFKSESYIRALQGTSDLIRDGQALRYANFAKVYLPCIPLNEQKEIADYIDMEVRRIDNAMIPIAKQMELLRERRTRLISDVVTGQVDVCDVVVPDREAQDDGDEYDGAGA